MAGLALVAQTEAVATTTAKKTVLQITAPANQRLLVREISVSFAGIVNTDAPILVQVLPQSTAGTGGDALTPQKEYAGDDETPQSTILKDIDTGEPTGVATGSLLTEYVHPQTGFTWQAPNGKAIVVKGGTALGIAVTAGVSVNCVSRIRYEE
mgnify:CR=1 FL=1